MTDELGRQGVALGAALCDRRYLDGDGAHQIARADADLAAAAAYARHSTDNDAADHYAEVVAWHARAIQQARWESIARRLARPAGSPGRLTVCARRFRTRPREFIDLGDDVGADAWSHAVPSGPGCRDLQFRGGERLFDVLIVDPSSAESPQIGGAGQAVAPPHVPLPVWYRKRVEGWPADEVRPSRDQDYAAARAAGYTKTGTTREISRLRRTYASHWGKPGPKEPRKR